MDSKHIEREYSAHRKNIIRPYDEYVKLEIFSFDPKFTKTYLREDGSLKPYKNATATSWKSWSCYKSKDKQNPMLFRVGYNVTEMGEYRIDVLYEQNNYIHDGKTNTNKDLVGNVLVDGKTIDDNDYGIIFDGENNQIKRITLFTNFNEKGARTIEVEVPHNCYFYGLMVRKQLTFIGDNYYGSSLGSEEGNMVLTSATYSISDMMKASELSTEIFYDTAFECDLSPSGFFIDYHDEVNFYVKSDNNEIERVFGGYVSSILPDADRTKLKISCADRLIDGQNKYILDQIRLGGGTSELKETGYSENMNKDFDSYPKALKYLCDIHEITLKSNISNQYTVDGEKFHDGLILSYGSGKNIKSIPTTNGYSKAYKNYILVRNTPTADKKQVWTLYDAKKNAKTPLEFTDKPYMHITYGLGAVKTEYKTKVTETVDNAETTAGSQKFTKCGVSQDGKYLMAIGLPSASKDSKSGWTKTVFKRKCPHCGSSNLVWDIDYGEGGYAPCRGANEGGGYEGHIFCKGCDADYSCQGHEHYDDSSYKLEKVSSTVASSKAEKDKLRSGQMVAVPSTAVTITPDDVFKAITKIAFKYQYKLGTSSSYNDMKRSGRGDCWAFSDLIFTELKKYGVSCKIVEYATNYADNHRSVLYKDKNNKWADFPYREYGWNTKYNNMLNNTSGSRNGRNIAINNGHTIGTIKASTSTSKKQTTTITNTNGYDKSKPFQGYIRLTYSLEQKFDAKKYAVNIKFTQTAPSTTSINNYELPLYWVNNTIKKTTLKKDKETLVSFLNSIHGDSSRYFLQSIQFIAPKVTSKDNKDTDWYKSDKSTNDNSSCKLNLYQIVFDNNPDVEPSNTQSCGKSVNSMMQELVKEAGYYVSMSYGLHRRDDRINFRVANQTKEQYTASEGDNNNILQWGSISYSPVGSLFNMSMQIFKLENNEYKYIDTKDSKSILNYGEQCTLQSNNEVMGEREAYFNATTSDKYNPTQTYTYTITVPNYPKLKIGDLVKVVANAKKLNSVKEVKSIKIKFDTGKMPRIQTELGLDELAPDIQLQKTLRTLRSSTKQETTTFNTGATPVTDEIYYEWDR